MRPLRVREIEDGIAFRHDCAKPRMENRICRSIFDLCGPLIEELPDGCVDTVHFSAKEYVTPNIQHPKLIYSRYLLHPHSGPFIDRAMAHRSLAFSCLHYLNSRVDLASHSHSSPSPHTIESRIINSLNGLDHYSHQFWIDHVLIYMKDPPDATLPSKLIDVLNEVSLIWLQGRPPLPESKHYQLTENLLYFGNHPAALELMRQALAFRRKLGTFERDRSRPEGKVPTMSFHRLILI